MFHSHLAANVLTASLHSFVIRTSVKATFGHRAPLLRMLSGVCLAMAARLASFAMRSLACALWNQSSLMTSQYHLAKVLPRTHSPHQSSVGSHSRWLIFLTYILTGIMLYVSATLRQNRGTGSDYCCCFFDYRSALKPTALSTFAAETLTPMRMK